MSNRWFYVKSLSEVPYECLIKQMLNPNSDGDQGTYERLNGLHQDKE